MTRSRKRSLFITFSTPPPPGRPGEGGDPVTTMMVGEEKGKPDCFSSSRTGEWAR